MSDIHYFPRYSQKENMTTNNALLLFSRLYNNSNDKFNRFLVNLFEDEGIEFDTKINFKQQVKSENSVPDGMIYQESFKIVLETKLYGQKNIKQIINHLTAFGDENISIFFLIDKEDISSSFKREIEKVISKFNDKNDGKEIQFIATTFKKICSKFEETLNDYHFEMIDIINDYKAFCYESDLINNCDTKIRVVLCGKTLEQNMRTNIYYAPSGRGYQASKYIGLYKNKAVRAIGELTAIIDIGYVDGQFIDIVEHKGKLKEKMKEILFKIFNEAREEFGYNLTKNTRFFFVDEFIDTEFTKITKGGLMGTRYFDLLDIDGYRAEMSSKEIARILQEKEWK